MKRVTSTSQALKATNLPKLLIFRFTILNQDLQTIPVQKVLTLLKIHPQYSGIPECTRATIKQNDVRDTPQRNPP